MMTTIHAFTSDQKLQDGGHKDYRRARAASDGRWRAFAAPGQWVRLTAMTESSWSEGYGESRKYYNRFGLEAESPYFDRRLVEYVMALPAEQLGRPWRNRWVQRNAMVGLLPAAVRERVGKTNFEPLMTRGLFEREIGIVHTILAEPRSVERNVVRSGWLRQALEDQRFASEHGYELWQIISLELWLQKQSDLAYVSTPV